MIILYLITLFPVAVVVSDIFIEETCTICLENPTNIIFPQCKHAAVCHICLKKLKKEKAPCPICRSPFKNPKVFSIRKLKEERNREKNARISEFVEEIILQFQSQRLKKQVERIVFTMKSHILRLCNE